MKLATVEIHFCQMQALLTEKERLCKHRHEEDFIFVP